MVMAVDADVRTCRFVVTGRHPTRGGGRSPPHEADSMRPCQGLECGEAR